MNIPTEFIHYGSDHFDKTKFTPVRNDEIPFAKPAGGSGFWATPSDDEYYYTWKTWCEENDFYIDKLTKSFIFSLKPGSKVLPITNPRELDEAKKKYNIQVFKSYLAEPALSKDFHPDFESISKNYDAMYVKIYFDESKSWDEDPYWQLYGWDVDTLLIFNPDIIQE